MSDLTELESSQPVKIASSDPNGVELAFVNFMENQREILSCLGKICEELNKINQQFTLITDTEKDELE